MIKNKKKKKRKKILRHTEYADRCLNNIPPTNFAFRRMATDSSDELLKAAT